MQFYIPEISDEIRLLADWHFDLHNEDRNDSLAKFLKTGQDRTNRYPALPPVPIVIPAGSILIIDRIYIRKGSSEFSSITFRWKGVSNPAYYEERQDYSKLLINGVPTKYDYKLHGSISSWIPVMIQSRVSQEPIRFWAKLDEVNRIQYEKV